MLPETTNLLQAAAIILMVLIVIRLALKTMSIIAKIACYVVAISTVVYFAYSFFKALFQ